MLAILIPCGLTTALRDGHGRCDQRLSRGLGPKTSLLALGYAGWAAGQLEAEIRANGWLICEAEFDLVFSPDNGAKWAAALASIGVDPTLLSGQAGRA